MKQGKGQRGGRGDGESRSHALDGSLLIWKEFGKNRESSCAEGGEGREARREETFGQARANSERATLRVAF